MCYPASFDLPGGRNKLAERFKLRRACKHPAIETIYAAERLSVDGLPSPNPACRTIVAASVEY